MKLFWATWLGVLLLLGASAGVSAQGRGPRSVVWIEHHTADDAVRHAREKALRLELQARDISLLGAVSAPPAAGESDKPLAETARALLGRTGPAAVLWLEADPARPVSWLYVRRHDREELGKAPLPYPPEAIDTQLFALAAASLLDQVLREPVAAASPVPTPVAVPTPAAVAAAAPLVRATPVAPAPEPIAPLLEPLPRYFVQVGFAAPLAMLSPGLEASSEPDFASVFSGSPIMGETRYFFTDTSIYIPDADSFDDYENLELGIERGTTPVQETCEGDGIETHAPELPSKYCVRVSEPGFVFVPALRLAFGTWLTPDIALALAYQWHFTVQPDTFFGAQSLTLEGHYIVLGDRASGGSLALVAELGAGRTETPVEQAPFDASVSMHKPPVNALTGPLEAAAGLAVRYALTPRASLIASLRFGGRFPATQLVTGLTAALEYGL